MPRGRVPHNLTGQVFSRLTALDAVGRHRYGGILWRCLCECGNETRALARELRNGKKKSCGCLIHDACREAGKRQFEHGHDASNSSTYRSWAGMRTRCNNPNDDHYPRYGERGITICERWNSFPKFLEDMGERPEGMTLDRYPNNDGNYEPGNCRWATPREQARNRSNNVMVWHEGREVTLPEFCEITGQNQQKLRYRVSHGLSLVAGSPP